MPMPQTPFIPTCFGGAEAGFFMFADMKARSAGSGMLYGRSGDTHPEKCEKF